MYFISKTVYNRLFIKLYLWHLNHLGQQQCVDQGPTVIVCYWNIVTNSVKMFMAVPLPGTTVSLLFCKKKSFNQKSKPTRPHPTLFNPGTPGTLMADGWLPSRTLHKDGCQVRFKLATWRSEAQYSTTTKPSDRSDFIK